MILVLVSLPFDSNKKTIRFFLLDLAIPSLMRRNQYGSIVNLVKRYNKTKS
jgi:hypothetical protein